MKSVLKFAALSVALLLLFTGCVTTPATTEAPTTTQPGGTQGVEPSATAANQNDPITDSAVYDYTYSWWPNGFPGGLRTFNMMSGRFGVTINAIKGQIERFGAFAAPVNRITAMTQDNSVITDLPSTAMKYTVSIGGTEYELDKVNALDEKMNSTRLLESGNYLQRTDLMRLESSTNESLCGRLEVTVLPDYFAVNLEVQMYDKSTSSSEIAFAIDINEIYTDIKTSADGRSVMVRTAEGDGYTVLVPSQSSATVTVKDGAVVCSNSQRIYKSKFMGFGVIIIPSMTVSPDDAVMFEKRTAVSVTADQIMPNEREQDVEYDFDHGMYSINMDNAFSVVEGKFTDENIDTYERVTFTLKNDSDKTVSMPVQFIKNNPLAVTGSTPMLLDSTTGEPTGHPVQITRNWHYGSSTYDKNSPLRYWEGRWYHCYTVIDVPANSTVSYDFCVSYGRWGGIEGVVHSQLCLAGWDVGTSTTNQQWETCSLGAYGESFCYDIAHSYTWCVMGDICPFGLYSRVDGKKYNWTTNTGGVDFIGWYDLLGNSVRTASAKTWFKNHGPNLSEVKYAGFLGNRSIQFEISAFTPRTDDISMAYQTFKYTFLDDVKYRRMFFYQFGADSYNYNYWDRMVVGNNDGPISFTAGGKEYSGEFAVPAYNSYEQYISGGNMDRIPVPGNGAWFAFLGAAEGESKGNKAISVKEYNAVINGETYTQPSFSVRSTRVLEWDGGGFELNPPVEADGIIKKGSVVTFVIEYYNLPAHKAEYYGTSSVLAAVDAADYDTWKLPYLYATQNDISVTADTGTVERTLPALVRSTGAESGVVAQFTINKGIGYVPVTISGVKGYSGWRLERKNGDAWEELKQGVIGNDYWQTWQNPEDGTFELTFNVPANGNNDNQTYRLIKK